MSALRLYAAPLVLAMWAAASSLGLRGAVVPLLAYAAAQVVSCRERYRQLLWRRRRRGGRHVRSA